MIRCCVETTEIEGNPLALTIELENLNRAVRGCLISAFGEEKGSLLFEEAIKGARQDIGSRLREINDFYRNFSESNSDLAAEVNKATEVILAQMRFQDFTYNKSREE